MIGKFPKQSLGRQIAHRRILHKSCHRPAHRVLVRAAIPQQPCTHHFQLIAVHKGKTQLQASFPRQLVRQQARNQQALAMHESSRASDYAASGQVAEQPMGAASTSSAVGKSETPFLVPKTAV